MKSIKIINKFIFLGKLVINFKRSELAYKNYLNEDKIYLHARVLMECNTLIRNLLLENAFLLREDLRDDAIDLIGHYDLWIEKWKDLQDKLKPELNDKFVFENTYIFPKEAEQRIMEEFIKMKNNLQ